MVNITRHYAEIGLGRDSDANRAFSQWKRRRALVVKAEEELAVTAARLANRLNVDPSAKLQAAGGPLVELELVDLGSDQRELLQVALRQRPDIAAGNAAVGEAEFHMQARNRQAASAHALVRVQRRRLWRWQQPRAAPGRKLRRTDRLRRQGLLDAAQYGRRQPLAHQGAPRLVGEMSAQLAKTINLRAAR